MNGNHNKVTVLKLPRKGSANRKNLSNRRGKALGTIKISLYRSARLMKRRIRLRFVHSRYGPTMLQILRFGFMHGMPPALEARDMIIGRYCHTCLLNRLGFDAPLRCFSFGQV
jgi:hypothetical protein